MSDFLSKLHLVPVSQDCRAKKSQDTGFCNMVPPPLILLFDLAPNDPMCCAPGIRLFILELSCTILSLIIWIHWQSAVCLHERILLHLYTALVQFAVCKERDNIFVSAFLRWELIYLWNSDYFLHDNFTKWFIDIVCETKLWAYVNVYSQDDYIEIIKSVSAYRHEMKCTSPGLSCVIKRSFWT